MKLPEGWMMQFGCPVRSAGLRYPDIGVMIRKDSGVAEFAVVDNGCVVDSSYSRLPVKEYIPEDFFAAAERMLTEYIGKRKNITEVFRSKLVTVYRREHDEMEALVYRNNGVWYIDSKPRESGGWTERETAENMAQNLLRRM